MKITKKFIAILMISILSMGMAILAIGCYPLMPAGEAEEGGTAVAEGAEGGISGMLAQYGTWVWLIVLGAAFYFLLINVICFFTLNKQLFIMLILLNI